MPQPTKGPRFGGSAAHQKHIMANLATALFEHGRITTTEAKARALRPYAEKLITKAKKAELGTVQSLHNRRLVLRVIKDKGVVHALFTEIGPGFAERPGGYTRITKIGPRKGDNAPMAVIELVTEPYAPSAPKTKAAPATTASAPVEEIPAEASAADDEAPDEETPAEESAAESAEEGTAGADAPTELGEEASPEESVVAEEEPVADEASEEPAAEGDDDDKA